MPNKILSQHTLPGGISLELVQGDITRENVDAIVNAANSHLQHGGGVAGAIVRAGGYEIQTESNKIGYVPVGEAAITSAGKLSASYVIHAVGPRWGEGDEDAKLKSAVRNTLILANNQQLESVSLPAISSGIFGFPKERCARIILDTIVRFCSEEGEKSVKKIRICLFDAPTVKAFQKAYQEKFHADE